MLDDAALDRLFRTARSTYAFTSQCVTDEVLLQLYELLKWGPTAWNSQPGRYVFVRSAEARARLVPALSSTNRPKALSAPVTAIVAYDTRFFGRLDEWGASRSARQLLSSDAELAQITALRNGSLQGAYLMLAARALGLGVGPISGFNPEAVNREFFAGSTWRVNFLVGLGFPEESAARPRAARMRFEEAVRLV